MKVLLIDCDNMCLEAHRGYLERCGYTCCAYNNPIDALESLHHNQYDVAVVEYVMPLVSGREAVKRIKEVYPTTKIVLISGLLDLDDLQMASRKKADVCYIKPLQLESLISFIKSVENEIM